MYLPRQDLYSMHLELGSTVQAARTTLRAAEVDASGDVPGFWWASVASFTILVLVVQ